VDLPDLAQRLQVAGEIGPAHADAEPIVTLGEGANHVPPQKARSAENGDEGL
jgi:hypothetical protein